VLNDSPGNTKLIGINRSEAVMDLAELFKYITAQHIAKLVYAKLKPVSALRKARHRLQVLHEEGKLSRYRESIYQSYVYYVGKRSSHAESCLQVATFYTELVVNSKQWQKVISIDIEKKVNFNDGTHMVADAFIKYKITEDKIVNFYVEIENSPHDFNKKIDNYNKLALELGLSRAIIPVVVIASPTRKERLKAKIVNTPSEMVKFSVISTLDIKLDYLCWYKELTAPHEKGRARETIRESHTEKLGTVQGLRPRTQPPMVAPTLPTGVQRPKITSQSTENRKDER